MLNKVVQWTIFLLLTLRSEARQEDVIHQPLIQEELEPRDLVPTPCPQHHQVGGLRPDEGGSPLSVLGDVLRGEGRVVPGQAQSGQEGQKCLGVGEVGSVDSSSRLSSLEPSQTLYISSQLSGIPVTVMESSIIVIIKLIKIMSNAQCCSFRAVTSSIT